MASPTAAQSALTYFPPMGVYETLFKFLDATGKYMGTEGTHPWAQGFPLTTPIPGGPDIPGVAPPPHPDTPAAEMKPTARTFAHARKPPCMRDPRRP